MSSLRNSLLLLLSVGVAAPAAARPRGPAAAFPGVSDVLLNLHVAAPVFAGPRALPLTAWLGLTDLPVAVPAKQPMWCGGDFNLQRLVAEWREFDGSEVSTSQGVPGISLYTKTVSVPDGCDTLYVTLDATGDENVGTWFTCKVDGIFCNGGLTFATGTAGWISLQHNPVPPLFQEDNNIHYTWCTPITGGQDHFVEIRMAAEVDGTGSFIEGEHFFIDASYTGGGCVQAAPAEDPPPVPKVNTANPAAPPPAPPALPPLPKLP